MCSQHRGVTALIPGLCGRGRLHGALCDLRDGAGGGSQILWNAQTQHYVLFFHCDTGAFEYPAVGVARSQSITGPYTWVRRS